MILRFLCGCSSNLLDTPKENRAAVIATLDSITFDSEGLIVCAIHSQRRFGWRPPAPAAARGIRHMTPLQFQELQLFGVPLEMSDRTVKPLSVDDSQPDLRPTDAPSAEEVYAAVDEARANIVARQRQKDVDALRSS